MKSTVEELRRRFDADVERFSNLETGQSATVDAPLAMALVAEAAAATTPNARHVLDVGCGAGTWRPPPAARLARPMQPERCLQMPR
jgi:tRNA (cmo5U34)-methyltransferase